MCLLCQQVPFLPRGLPRQSAQAVAPPEEAHGAVLGVTGVEGQPERQGSGPR